MKYILHTFYLFLITLCLVVYRCRRPSDIGFARGSLGSFFTAIVRRPLYCFPFYSIVQRGRNRIVLTNDKSVSSGALDTLKTLSHQKWPPTGTYAGRGLSHFFFVSLPLPVTAPVLE